MTEPTIVGASGKICMRAWPVTTSVRGLPALICSSYRHVHHDELDLPAEQFGRRLRRPR